MNGAHALLATLEAHGVEVCFANPGTSEMHFVAALDDATTLRSVLCLFEGVATGAADGYARVTGRPAATLLHLGPGLANGWANLHNARRAGVPLVNIVGDHATYHAVLDAPLQSNIELLAAPLEGWFRRSTSPSDVADDLAAAIRAAAGPPGRVATLVVPADVSWGEGASALSLAGPPSEPARPTPIDESSLTRAIDALRSRRSALVVGSHALTKERLALAARVAAASSSQLLMETFPAIVERGAGVVEPERLIYLSEFAAAQLAESDVVILLGAKEPVGFFAYPGVPSRQVAPDAEVIDLAPPGSDVDAALAALVAALGAPPLATPTGERPGPTHGELSPRSFAQAVGATLPEDVVVADESNTSGVHLFEATRFAPAHRWMTLTGGAIGYGLPVALGAAIGSGQRVLALESDGSMMYTPQALWTMAREGLDVTVVALANRSYAVLHWELARVGATREGAASRRLLDLDAPVLDLAGIARGLGVPSARVESAEDLSAALERSYATPGPMFIEAVLASPGV
jgi:acetolactate synthase-1/2/3 large subunit